MYAPYGRLFSIAAERVLKAVMTIAVTALSSHFGGGSGRLRLRPDVNQYGREGHRGRFGAGPAEVNAPEPDSATTAPAPAGESLAETGGDGSTRYLTIGGAAALFAPVRRRAAVGGRHRH
ncbi:hypothetical protein ACFTXM_18300 [Streptomyces sp. NPDC056930]|uniref:hypothetical protein n=1 Tax=Streptomyces sp. NPDC056930 TaxID=3345967 RepID=UPI00363F6021